MFGGRWYDSASHGGELRRAVRESTQNPDLYLEGAVRYFRLIAKNYPSARRRLREWSGEHGSGNVSSGGSTGSTVEAKALSRDDAERARKRIGELTQGLFDLSRELAFVLATWAISPVRPQDSGEWRCVNAHKEPTEARMTRLITTADGSTEVVPSRYCRWCADFTRAVEHRPDAELLAIHDSGARVLDADTKAFLARIEAARPKPKVKGKRSKRQAVKA